MKALSPTPPAKSDNHEEGAKSVQVQPAGPARLASLFGNRIAITAEHREIYNDLLAQFRDAIKPADFIQELLLRNVADLVWETERLRRIQAALLLTARETAVANLLEPRCLSDEELGYEEPCEWSENIAREWSTGDPKALEIVDRILAENGLDDDAIMAEALSSRLDEFERIQSLIATSEARRDRVLRDLGARAASAALRQRAAAIDVPANDQTT